MPWKETSAVEERTRFVLDLKTGLYTMTELCEQYGVSRPTGYKWTRRYAEVGLKGLEDLSRAPRSCPHRSDEKVVEKLIEARKKHPHWGPVTLRDYLLRKQPELVLPAPSTIGELLKREGLVRARRKRRREVEHPGRVLIEPNRANRLWSCDYKGKFRTLDGLYCHSLTVSDNYSRYLLGCDAQLSPTGAAARRHFERLFREYGLPWAILSDNGTPFASSGLGWLSRLSVWWTRLGVRPVLIDPGHPEQNPRHERMHWTLKQETACPPARHLKAQQRRFDHFRREYNEERPHQGLEGKVPSDYYETSARPYPKKLPPLNYPGHFEVRRVGSNSGIKLRGGQLFLTTVLTGEDVGLEEIDDGVWSVYFGCLYLGRYVERENDFYPGRPVRIKDLCNC